MPMPAILAAFLGSMATQGGMNIANKLIPGAGGGGSDVASTAMEAFMKSQEELNEPTPVEPSPVPSGGAPQPGRGDPIMDAFMGLEEEWRRFPGSQLAPGVIRNFPGVEGRAF